VSAARTYLEGKIKGTSADDTSHAASSNAAMPALVVSAGVRILKSFALVIRNPHTRWAFARAAGDFLVRCAGAGVPSCSCAAAA
jgi:hypothetical protein